MEILEQQTRHHGGGGTGAGASWGRPSPYLPQQPPPNAAVHKKLVETLPLLVSSCTAAAAAAEASGEAGSFRVASGYGAGSDVAASGELSSSLADAALSFLSREIASLVAAAGAAGWGPSNRRRMTLTRAFLGVLETCYHQTDGTEGGEAWVNGDDDVGDGPLGPESWPWNTAANAGQAEGARNRSGVEVTSDRWHPPPSWPVRSLPLWGPRLADIAGDRESRSWGGAPAETAVDRAARVVELVLRRHAGEAWKQALCALRPQSSPRASGGGASAGRFQAVGSNSGRSGGGGGGGGASKKSAEEAEGEGSVVPLCGPLLERICLELPLMALPVRVHRAVFEAHGWLSLLPCGAWFGLWFTLLFFPLVKYSAFSAWMRVPLLLCFSRGRHVPSFAARLHRSSSTLLFSHRLHKGLETSLDFAEAF